MADSRITVRLSAAQDAKLAELAAAASTTKVQALRRLIDTADAVGEQLALGRRSPAMDGSVGIFRRRANRCRARRTRTRSGRGHPT